MPSSSHGPLSCGRYAAPGRSSTFRAGARRASSASGDDSRGGSALPQFAVARQWQGQAVMTKLPREGLVHGDARALRHPGVQAAGRRAAKVCGVPGRGGEVGDGEVAARALDVPGVQVRCLRVTTKPCSMALVLSFTIETCKKRKKTKLYIGTCVDLVISTVGQLDFTRAMKFR